MNKKHKSFFRHLLLLAVSLSLVCPAAVLAAPEDQALYPVSPVYEPKEEVSAEKPLDLTLHYDEGLLEGADPRSLVIYHECSSTPGKWIYVGGVVDPASKTLTAKISKARKYAIMADRPLFTDLAGHWSENDVRILATHNLVGGAGGALFQPDRPITRAELTNMLVNLANIDPARRIRMEDSVLPAFPDVPADAWYFNPVETAYRLGIIQGAGKPFRPDAPATREEMAMMVVRVLNSEDQKLPDNGTSWPFKDFFDISPAAVNSVLLAYGKGLMNGVSADSFQPRGTSTRAQAAVTVLRTMERMGLLTLTSVINGTLRISEIEGTHFELVDTDTDIAAYVLIPGSADLKHRLEDLEDWKVRITAVREGDVGIYMRGPVLRVLNVVGTCGVCAKDKL
ncbi:MAG: S-layer homology domain-containing protein [Clostridia bacterium]|jgi:hypothetical protein|nr:S-layer homology domain-containing protein [Clostridia bacterium]